MIKNLMKFVILALWLLPGIIQAQPSGSTTVTTDVCVYGGTSSGVIAAYTASKMGKRVILVEPSHRLGGLSSGGLGFTDIGNKYVVTGLARDFYRRIGTHYGKLEQWTFEPRVADSLFNDYAKRGAFKTLYGKRLTRVNKNQNLIVSIELENSAGDTTKKEIIKAKQYIDCTYEGDLMAKAGVSYTIGREANSTYNETVNGVQLKNEHQFPDGVDPYKIPGKPESGLLWGISAATLAETGSGDKKVQAYNFRICLSNDPGNRIAITRPANYDSTRYELLLRYLAVKTSDNLGGFLKMDLMPNHKTDINNNGPFSTDMIGMNYNYPDGDYLTRSVIIQKHEDYTKGLLYFIGHDARMPGQLRKQMLEWGYPKDEYLDNNHWTPQLYVREARRMIGAYVMTQANCQGREVVTDEIGKAAYTMDSHNAERIVVNGMVKNEGDVQLREGVNPYPIAYRSITPKSSQCGNLLVPVCLSASHMAYGSIRMEPVFMVLGQSAAVAACLAIKQKSSVQQINIKQLQAELKNNPLADGSTPDILVDNDDVTGVIKEGDWKQISNGGYGPSYLVNTVSASAWVQFIPTIRKGGRYRVYVYCPKLQKASTITSVELFNGIKSVNTIINVKDMGVTGQTSGEWLWIGDSSFVPGKNASVKISNTGANGVVVADAVLLIPAK
ncbi:hypothetical protein HDF22_000622 [Mucilaginibacter lappiensis]|uniref:Golvesin/Xly CBD-like domain-containing protein n=2 Tax=Mucilaginibacter lappiensis TaxID=354630 RepID=A0A841J6U6_9SPHI|nr:hypothetical protein [Mucilaginibacter lappiensis]